MSFFRNAVAAVLVLASQLPPRAVLAKEAPSPLPQNKACPYPDRAREEQVAGVVSYTARLQADGTVWAVEIGRVPLPDLGFEVAVRTCVSEWRFTPAAAPNDRSRVYEGQVRFRRASAEEVAVREQLEKLAAAWSAGDEAAIADLQARPEDSPTAEVPNPGPLRDQLRALTELGANKAELAPDVDLFWFLRSDVVQVRQRYRVTGRDEATTAEQTPLRASLLKGARGWRFVSLAAPGTETNPIKIGGEIREPTKIKHVNPVYPQVAKEARVQGAVILECTISPEGAIVATRVLRGIPLLDQAAIDAVKQWRYTPTFVNGKAVAVLMTVTVTFRLS